jgi:hypothetical protein
VGVRRSSVPSRGSRSGQRKRSLSGEQARKDWRQGSEAARRLAVSTSGVMVASYVRERERIFLRWLENVQRLLNQPVATPPTRHGATATASANMPVRWRPIASHPWPRADRGRTERPEPVMVELAEYAAPVVLLAAVAFVLASTRPAR